jgi:hypothetical protein
MCAHVCKHMHAVCVYIYIYMCVCAGAHLCDIQWVYIYAYGSYENINTCMYTIVYCMWTFRDNYVTVKCVLTLQRLLSQHM